MTIRVEVERVATPGDDRLFCGLPYRVYGGDPCWVPPLRKTERERFRYDRNSSLDSRSCTRFLARTEGRVVGRIAAVVDQAFTRLWEEGTGFFGFFECDDDGSAAAALLSAAEDELRRAGMTTVLGPVNLSTHDEVGLLVEGFGSSPSFLTPYNPPYYAELLLASGYRRREESYAYRWTPGRPHSRAVDRLLRARSSRDDRLRVRALDPRAWDQEVHLLHELYNGSFEGLWGFVPMKWEEFDERARAFRAFYDPSLVLIAEKEGEPAAFGIVLPDINQALRAAGGRLWPFGWFRLLRAVPRIRTGRFILLGVRPELAGRGLAPLLVLEMEKAVLARGLSEVEVSIVQGRNAAMRRVIEAFGCTRSKTFAIFEKTLAG